MLKLESLGVLLDTYNPGELDNFKLGKNNREFIASASSVAEAAGDKAFNIHHMRQEVNDALSSGLIPYPDGLSESNYITQSIGSLVCHVLKNENAHTVPTLVIFFGGGFCLNTLIAHKSFMANIASKMPCHVILPEIPLAPENKAPEILEILNTFMLELTQNSIILGFSDDITLLGWSSGANLALTLALNLRDISYVQFSKISHVIAMSSWIDLSMNTIRHAPYQKQQAVDCTAAGDKVLTEMSKCYLKIGDRGDEPLYCPAARGDEALRDLPFVTLIAGEYDVILGDSVYMAHMLNHAGTPSQLIILKGQTHNYLVFEKLSRDGIFVPDLIVGLIKEKSARNLITDDDLGIDVIEFNAIKQSCLVI